jgi:hypothetical protein
MLKVEIKGFEKLQRDLDNAARALRGLDGTVASLSFNSNDAENVRKAIRQMECPRALKSDPGCALKSDPPNWLGFRGFCCFVPVLESV